MLSFELPQFIIQNYLYEGCNFSLALFIEELLKDAKIYEINQGIQNYYFIKYKNVYIDIIGIYDSEDEFLNRYQFPSKYNSNPELIQIQPFKDSNRQNIIEVLPNNRFPSDTKILKENIPLSEFYMHHYYATLIIEKVEKYMNQKLDEAINIIPDMNGRKQIYEEEYIKFEFEYEYIDDLILNLNELKKDGVDKIYGIFEDNHGNHNRCLVGKYRLETEDEYERRLRKELKKDNN